MEDNPILEAKNLFKTYKDTIVLNDLSFNIKKGEIVALLGPNGAGKTTAFYITIGLIKQDKGSLLFKDNDITDIPIHKRARMGLGYLAQEPSVFKKLTVEQNILCILETLPLSKKEQKKRLKELLKELKIESLAKRQVSSLSGGERRRLEITRCLITTPSLLLLDEPFANIDPIAVNEVKSIIKILKTKGISIFITDHNARELCSIVDRSYLIRDGKVIMHGAIDELLENKEARLTYFGEDFRL